MEADTPFSAATVDIPGTAPADLPAPSGLSLTRRWSIDDIPLFISGMEDLIRRQAALRAELRATMDVCLERGMMSEYEIARARHQELTVVWTVAIAALNIQIQDLIDSMERGMAARAQAREDRAAAVAHAVTRAQADTSPASDSSGPTDSRPSTADPNANLVGLIQELSFTPDAQPAAPAPTAIMSPVTLLPHIQATPSPPRPAGNFYTQVSVHHHARARAAYTVSGGDTDDEACQGRQSEREAQTTLGNHLMQGREVAAGNDAGDGPEGPDASAQDHQREDITIYPAYEPDADHLDGNAGELANKDKHDMRVPEDNGGNDGDDEHSPM